MLAQSPRPPLDDPSAAVYEVQAGERLCRRLAREEDDDPTLFIEGIIAFTYGRGLAWSHAGDTHSARRACTEVLRRTNGASDMRLQAFAARAQVNLLGLLPASEYVRRMLGAVIARLAGDDSPLFAEPYCKASLNLADLRQKQGRRDDERLLLSLGLRRARSISEPWVDAYVRHVEALLRAA
jgi:hypothetical protein